MQEQKTKNHTIAVIIPARYHSSRLPGKPLALIAGQTMLLRVWTIAQHIVNHYSAHQGVQVQAYVTTEDSRIVDYCNNQGISCILTADSCRTGTQRVAHACHSLTQQPDFIVNLQGDNALCPPWFLTAVIDQYLKKPSETVISPYVQLTWAQLDQFRCEKQLTPFSGTTVVFNDQQQAYWFSKNIIPAMRHEKMLRLDNERSPVCRHIGLYGYHRVTLAKILELSESRYENLEGLEQLSFLDAGIAIQMVQVDYQSRQGMSGIDSPEDIARAETIIQQDGELV